MAKYRHEGIMLLLEYPEYAKRWVGSVVSGLGNQLGWMALVWLVMELAGSASSIGIVTLLYQLPQAIFAPLAGVVLDRYPRARVMAIANFALAVVFTCIPIVAMSLRRNGLWLICFLVAMAGIMMPFDTTGSGPLIADLVPIDRLSQANFLNQTIWQIVYLVGPAIGGVLIAWIGSNPLLFFDAATFLFLGVLMLTVAPKQRQKLTVDQDLFHNLKGGIAYLVQNRPLLALAVLSLLFNLFYGPYLVLLPDLAKSQLGGSTALGLLWFAFSMGALGGGLVFSSKSWTYRLSASLAGIIVGWGLMTVVLAYVTNHLWLACVTMFVGGLVFAPWGALVTTARQRIVPSELQGRVFGASALLTAAGTPVGAWLTGILLPSITPNSIFLMSGVVTICVGLTALLWPALRGVDGRVGEQQVM